jgi:hypothetical protein
MIHPRTRELIRKLRFYGEVYDYQREAADALEQSLTDIARLEERVRIATAWLDEAVSCGCCDDELREASAALKAGVDD